MKVEQKLEEVVLTSETLKAIVSLEVKVSELISSRYSSPGLALEEKIINKIVESFLEKHEGKVVDGIDIERIIKRVQIGIVDRIAQR